jgi:hypothetical protein
VLEKVLHERKTAARKEVALCVMAIPWMTSPDEDAVSALLQGIDYK